MRLKFGFALATICISIATSFLCAELIARILFPGKIKSTWLEMPDRGYMVNQRNISALHSFEDRVVRYRFSSFRTRGEFPKISRDSIVFVFGDSFTFGLLLEEEDTFIASLNRKLQESSLNRWYFVNSGVGGTGLADWVAYLEQEIDSLPLSAIWIVHNYDDFARMLQKRLYIIQGDSLVTSRRWRQSAIKYSLDKNVYWRYAQERSVLMSLFQDILWRYFYFSEIKLDEVDAGVGGEKYEYAIRLAELLYDRLLELTREKQIDLFVSSTGFILSDRLTPLNAAVFRALPRILSEREIPSLDITPMLIERAGGSLEHLQIPNDTHPNETATLLMAELYEQAFLRGHIFPSFRESP